MNEKLTKRPQSNRFSCCMIKEFKSIILCVATKADVICNIHFTSGSRESDSRHEALGGSVSFTTRRRVENRSPPAQSSLTIYNSNMRSPARHNKQLLESLQGENIIIIFMPSSRTANEHFAHKRSSKTCNIFTHAHLRELN